MRNEQGFSLAELMVTMVVAAIVITSISSLFINIQRTQRRTGYLESATRAAQREIEVLRNRQYNQLTPGVDINFTNQLPDNLVAPRSGIVEVSEPTPGLRQVDVTVTYRDGNEQRTVKLSSLIGVLGITQ
ncbi:MAG TPA: type II secretion system protein [Candidatus Saccharimonadales bacterium]|nr:type II secretion system protein [Candidatus Saccharimonadales bacterium]